MQKLTKEQAAIVGLYSGTTCGPFADIQEYAQKLTGQLIFTHQLANENFVASLKELAKLDFLSICVE